MQITIFLKLQVIQLNSDFLFGPQSYRTINQLAVNY